MPTYRVKLSVRDIRVYEGTLTVVAKDRDHAITQAENHKRSDSRDITWEFWGEEKGEIYINSIEEQK